ncbi:glycosyltransferase [Litorivicinus sp.]|nr:glycosyltransferase [Litorivicinus sp.]
MEFKRIIIVAPGSSGGGTEVSAVKLGHYLKFIGVDVVFLDASKLLGKKSYGKDCVCLKIYLYLKKIFYLRRVFQEFNPCVVISLLINTNLLTLSAGVGLSLPVIISERSFPGARDYGLVVSALRFFLYRSASALVVQTSSSADWFMQKGWERSRVFVIPNSVEFAEGDPEHKEFFGATHFQLYSLCRLIPSKRVEFLIFAMKELALVRHDWHFTIFGEGPCLSSLQELVKSLGLSEKISFAGWCGDKSLVSTPMDVFMSASVVEGFPNSLLEAMSYGHVCMHSRCQAGPSDVITSEDIGILMDIDASCFDWAKKLDELLNHREDLKKISINAISRAKDYSDKNILKLWIEPIMQVLE